MNIVIIILLLVLIGFGLFILCRFNQMDAKTGMALDEILQYHHDEVRKTEIGKVPEDYNYINDLFAPLLEKICENVKVEKDKIVFSNQQLNYILVCPDNGPRARIFLPRILEVDASDYRVPQVIDAGNSVAAELWGVRFHSLVVKNEENGRPEFHFSFTSDIYLAPYYPLPEKMLRSTFDAFGNAMASFQIKLREIANSASSQSGPNDVNPLSGFTNWQMN